MSKPRDRKAEFRELINNALASSPYNPQTVKIQGMTRDEQLKFHFIWCTGVLGELLVYSAIDLFEVRHKLESMAQGDQNDQ